MANKNQSEGPEPKIDMKALKAITQKVLRYKPPAKRKD